MDVAIEEAARKIEELLKASRQNDSGAKLEVNEKVPSSFIVIHQYTIIH